MTEDSAFSYSLLRRNEITTINHESDRWRNEGKECRGQSVKGNEDNVDDDDDDDDDDDNSSEFWKGGIKSSDNHAFYATINQYVRNSCILFMEARSATGPLDLAMKTASNYLMAVVSDSETGIVKSP